MTLQLSTPVKFVKRVGERIAEGLAKRGVETVEDLLYHLPFRYEDRLNPRSIAEMQAGDMASLIGDVRGSTLLRTKAGASLFEMTLGLSAPGDYFRRSFDQSSALLRTTADQLGLSLSLPASA